VTGALVDYGRMEEQTSVLARATKLRLPRLPPETSRADRVDTLCDHILETAIVRGELAELRMSAHVDLLAALEEWSSASSFRASKGVKANEQLKREEHPELAARIDRAKWTIARCTEEMDRLGGSDYDAASRAYTLLSGS
jgi:hypothetical protein